MHNYRVIAIATTVLILPVLAHADSVASSLQSTPALFNDVYGDPLRVVREGRQVLLTTTFTNSLDQEMPFVGLIEVRDTDGITIFLAWQTSTIAPLGSKTIGASWVAPVASAYQSRTFAISGFENPQVLSSVESYETEMPCVKDCIAH